jgi:hypothetical protein
MPWEPPERLPVKWGEHFSLQVFVLKAFSAVFSILASGRNRYVKRCFAVFLLLSLLPFSLLSAASAQTVLPEGRDLNALLERMEQQGKANGKLAEQYTSVMFWHNLNFDKNGKTTVDESAKYENVFVEGLPYSRKVEKNGKPLTGKDADWEQRRYDKAVDERKNMSLDEKRHSLHVTFHGSLPLSYLTTLFDNRALRRETIDGRETLVVESTPRAGAHPRIKKPRPLWNGSKPPGSIFRMKCRHASLLKSSTTKTTFSRARPHSSIFCAWLTSQPKEAGPNSLSGLKRNL